MSNMYPGIMTINPLAGSCLHACNYCYRNSLIRRFPKLKAKYSGAPRIDESFKWKTIDGKPKEVFVCSMTDLFAENVPAKAINEIVKKCGEYPDNRYYFHTKNPQRFVRIFGITQLPPHSVLAITVETNKSTWRISQAPEPARRFNALYHREKLEKVLSFSQADIMLAIEPIMDFDIEEFSKCIEMVGPDIISIGADTGHNNLVEPSAGKIEALIERFSKSDVRIKKNLKRLWPEAPVT